MILRWVNGVILECMIGDIANQRDMQAVVNAANAELRIGGGVAGAIHRAAGPKLEEECRSMAPIGPGEAVMSGAHELPNRRVIHCLGPVCGRDEPPGELLASCYRRALGLADGNGLTSIAFPAISTGAFGYPPEPAARVALTTVIDEIPNLTSVNHIRMVLHSPDDLNVHARCLVEITDRA